MMTVAGGILFAIAMISLIVGGATFMQIIQFQNELKIRGQANKIVRIVTALEKFNEQELKRKQDVMFAAIATAGIFGSTSIGLAIAGIGFLSSAQPKSNADWLLTIKIGKNRSKQEIYLKNLILNYEQY